MTDQPDLTGLPLAASRIEKWAAGLEADQRDRLSDERDSVADERDSVADDRELTADDRESVADDRDLRADHGDDSDSQVEQDGAAVERRLAQSVERGTASQDRGSAAADRVETSARRAKDQEAAAVGAHLALNSSAVVVSGISLLKHEWLRMSPPQRTSIVDRIHHHAQAVDRTLRRFLRGR